MDPGLVNDFLLVTAAAAAVVVALMVVTAVAAKRVDRVAVVDVTWGLGFVAVALASYLVGLGLGEGDRLRAGLVLAMVAVWGGRLAWHIRKRALGAHAGAEDPRYEKLLGGKVSEVGLGVAVRKVFLVQGLAIWFVSLPVQVAGVAEVAEDWGWVVLGAGVAVWALGLTFEAVGDAQLAAYKEIPKEQRPQVMETGLWRYTRHPNYFGDASVWAGLWLAGGLASGWLPGLLTLISPVAMTYFLVFATGARLLEQTMMKREGYPAYAERTSMFFPLPPKSR